MSNFKTWLTGRASKATPVDADELYLRDSVSGDSQKLTWANLKAGIKSYLQTAFEYLTLTGGTVTASTPLINGTQTWNNGAVTFEADTINITNTASAAASTVLDRKVGGVSKFKVFKDGSFSAITGSSPLAMGSDSNWFRVFNGSGPSGGYSGGISAAGVFATSNGGSFQWQSYAGGGTVSLSLARDADNTLAQRNDTNAQTANRYRSYTDASNYSRVTQKWNTTTAIYHAEGLGTGSDGSVAFNDAALATNATVGFVMVPSCAGAPTGVPADIPTGQIPLVFDSTNNKLYAYDGGWISTAALT